MPTKILVLDDEEDYRRIVRDILEGAGMEVVALEDGKTGLQKLDAYQPDMAIVDWMMPRMDGENFCRLLREDGRYKSIPVLMLTAKKAEEDELEALHFGVDDFLSKPFKPEQLLARVNALLRRASRA